MKALARTPLFIMIFFCMGANWDMSGFKPKWNMIGDEKPASLPTLAPVLTSPPPIEELPAVPNEPETVAMVESATIEPDFSESPKFEEIKPTKPATRTRWRYRRIRIFGRRR